MTAPKQDRESPGEPKIRKLMLEDIHRGDIKRTLRQDFEELKEFFLTKERRKRLESMGRFKRWLFQAFWLLKALILKLSPARRLLVLVTIFILTFKFQVNEVSFNFALLGSILLLFVLMLELKDKLLARRELETGRMVQLSLMPESSPQVSGWELWLFSQPANEVGGDLVDFLPISANRYAVALADVAGKGLGAALFMARLQATLRALAPDFSSPNRLGKKLNEIFIRDLMPNRFASLIYLEFSPDSGQVKLVNAGHLPPIVLTRDGLRETEKGSPALGILKDAEYREFSLHLKPGEMLVLYSDGLTETRNEQGDFLGEDRLKTILRAARDQSSAEAGRRILQAIDQFRGNAKMFDDLSIVLLKKK